MRSLTLGGLNPLNPAHYLAAIGSLALASRFVEGGKEATLHWPGSADPVSGGHPFRAVLCLPDWNIKVARALFKLFMSPCPHWPEEQALEDIAEGGAGLLEDQLERAKTEASRSELKSDRRRRVIAVPVGPDRKVDDVKKRAQKISLSISPLPTGRPTEKELKDFLQRMAKEKSPDKPLVVFGKGGVVNKIGELSDYALIPIGPQGTGRRFRDLALSALNTASTGDSARLAWLSNGRLTQNGNAEATSWMMGRKAGLLRPLREAIQTRSPNLVLRRLRQVLEGPAWPYETKGPMLGLDSDTSTDGARSIRNTDGASPPQSLEALRLIGEALPLFIVGVKGRVAPISREGAVAGLSALSELDRDALAFVYPLWSAPLTLPEVSVVLNYPWHRLIKSPAQLRQMGIWAVLVAPCRKKGSAGDPTERQFGRAVRVV